MLQFVLEYPYLFVVLLGLPAVILGYVLVPFQRRMMLVSGLTLTAFAPFLVLFEGSYWSPRRIVDVIPAPEDLVMNFSIGSLVWLCAAVAAGRSIQIDFRWPMFLVRTAVLTTVSLASMFAFSFAGLGIMMAHIVTGFLMLIPLVLIAPGLRAMIIGPLLFYPPYYYFVLYLAGSVSDNFFQIWNGPELIGMRLFGLPVEELIWPFSFASYPLGIAYAANAMPEPEKTSDAFETHAVRS